MNEVDWLSDFPREWGEVRADFLCNPYRITVSPERYEGEMVAHYSIPQVQETGGPLVEPADDIDSSKLLISAPTLLVSKLNPRKRTICIAEPQGDLITLASGEFVPIRSDHFEQRYGYYLWSSEKVTDRLSAIVQSATRSHQRVNPADILKLPWKWPPLESQKRIVAFLDEKTTQIDTLIARKQAMLERLAEKRQAIITLAVTKGLNPAAPMKDSHIDWLGQIPAHWEVKRLKFDASKIGSGVTPRGGASVYVDEGIMLLRSQNIHFHGLRLDDVAFIAPEIDAEMAETRVHPSDVLLNITGASIGRCCVYDRPDLLANVNQHVCIIRPSDGLSSDFLSLVIASGIGQLQIDLSQNGASREGLNFDDLGCFFVPRPGRREQDEIATQVAERVRLLRLQVSKVEASIAALREYRSALITSAVTGQIEDLR